ncbi:MAG TPA: hypothetical protein VMY06_04540, partial [Sedimentisphaerales bacterium]|nr:hypothetical protein [Sedimentisphaerales bacterium]
MKFMKIIVLVLLLIGAQTAYGISAFDIRWGTDLISNQRSNTLKQWTESIEGRVTGSGGMGNHYYVDSGVVTEGDGTSWADARDTLDEAVALCTADNGDVIHVRAGHTEDWTAADSADLDVAGITVIGEGQGEARPLFTLDGAAAELVMGDASIMITNLRFMASVDSTVHIIEVEDDADGFIIYNCEFMEPESADTTDEADDIIQVAAGANQGFIVGNTFYSLSAGANTAIDLTAGVIEDITVAYNYINGAFAEGAIFSDDIDLRCRIIGNTVIQLDAAMTPITFNTTATGIMEDNWCTSKSTTYLIDAGSMHCKGNMWSDTDTADAAAVPMYTSETGVDIWAASQTTQITTASTAAI